MTKTTTFETNELFQKWLNEAPENGSYDLEKVKRQITEQIYELMQQQKLNKKQLADKAKLSPSYVNSLMRGDKTPSIETLITLAKALDAEIEIKFTR